MRKRNYILLALLMLLCASANAAAIPYRVFIDTSSISGTAGSLAFAFDPGFGLYQSATADILNFSPAANLGAAPLVADSVSGTLPPSITLSNAANALYMVGFTYASTISFNVIFDGPAITSPDGVSNSGTTFAFFMLNDDQSVPFLTSNVQGFAFLIDINLNGTTTVTDFITSTHTVAEGVPEPGSAALGLLGFGFMSAAILRRRRLTS
jgi:hypothetical protein